MKRVTVLFALSGLLAVAAVRAQQPTTADEACMHIASLLVNSDYAEVARYYPTVRDSLPPILCEMSEATTAYISGRPAESNAAIRRVITDYAEQAGLQNVVTMLNLAVYNYRTLNDYAGAGRTLREMLGLLPPEAEQARVSLTEYCRLVDALAEWPATTVRRPEGAAEIPADIRKAGRGEHLTLDVRMNGQTEPFVFDTGCSGSNFVDETTAERLGIRILADSVPVTGMTVAYAKIGVADSLQFGNITVLHPTFVITPQFFDIGSFAILGSDIIRALGEVRIEPGRERIMLPATPSAMPQKPNLLFSGGQYYLTCACGDEELLFQFDTGNAKSTLSQKFYTAHRDEIHSAGKKSTSTQGGLGGIKTFEVYVLPELTLDTPSRPATLHEITVNVREGMATEQDFESGSLGVDFLRACDAVTIDLGRMFVRTE